jgi:hypothetical protein
MMIGTLGAAPHLPAYREAVERREHDVEEDEVEAVGEDATQRLGSVRFPFHGNPSRRRPRETLSRIDASSSTSNTCRSFFAATALVYPFPAPADAPATVVS